MTEEQKIAMFEDLTKVEVLLKKVEETYTQSLPTGTLTHDILFNQIVRSVSAAKQSINLTPADENTMDVSDLKDKLIELGVPCTLEFPGFISINYRNYSICVQVEMGDVSLLTQSPNGYEVGTPLAFTLKNDETVEYAAGRVTRKLISMYKDIDEYIGKWGWSR